MKFKTEDVKVEFVDLNEGYNGVYDEDDEEDEMVFRLNVYLKNDDNRFLNEVSFSTRTVLPVESNAQVLEESLKYIGTYLDKLVKEGKDIKPAVEDLSYFGQSYASELLWRKVDLNKYSSRTRRDDIYIRAKDPVGLIKNHIYQVIRVSQVGFHKHKENTEVKEFEVSLNDESALTGLIAIRGYVDYSLKDFHDTDKYIVAIALQLDSIVNEHFSIISNDFTKLKSYLLNKYNIKY